MNERAALVVIDMQNGFVNERSQHVVPKVGGWPARESRTDHVGTTLTNMTQRPVLYVVVCAAPPALRIRELVALLMADGWTVCVITTPTATTWIDPAALAEQTDYPVRSAWRRPGEPGELPNAEAVLVAPATFNTINKWALGIGDNFALGLLNEMLGLRLPILVSPYAKKALTTHPAYERHVQVLSSAGVVFTPAEALRPATPEDDFQWRWLADEVSRLRG